ncbi:MAG: aminopeptidase [Nitrospirae bacterium]|nr:aminopeptidase [Nitrospirota bacterium]MBI5695952.1 aminopeptidase [Nitrospirota bacterium]
MPDTSKLVTTLKAVYNVNLAAKPGERVLVFTDLIPDGADIEPVEQGRREGLVRVARAARDAGEELGLTIRYSEFIALGSHGTEPDEGLWRLSFGDEAVDALKGAGLLAVIREKKATPEHIAKAREIICTHKSGAVNAVIALSNYSTSHTRYRDLLTSETGARYASMPLFEEDMLWGSMDVDWDKVADRTRRVAAAMRGAETAHVTTADGTDITFSIEGRPAREDTGMLREPGSFSNLPAGEVYTAPVEGTANGVLVINWAPNFRLASPLRVTVVDGRAAKVTGDDPYRERLVEGLDRFPDNRNIAELGIGTNDRATRPDNILESEKILGTVHMAFGDNSSMGGVVSTPFHQDFVYFGPTLTVFKAGAGTVILKDGKLVV